MASRAGVRIINAEYVQFHPTTFNKPGSSKFLISEAVRGEGAILLTPKGDAFMESYSPEWKDLAPRDIVSRAIFLEMLTNDYPHVFLDLASHKSAERSRPPEDSSPLPRSRISPRSKSRAKAANCSVRTNSDLKRVRSPSSISG